MTDRELMQQALDALELVTDLTNHDDEVYAAIEALRTRLAQPEPEPWGYISHKSWKMPVFVEADDLQAANLPYPEPWGYISHKSWKMPVFVEADDLQAANLPHNNPDYTPVYKAPPQRKWQGLTDEEITETLKRFGLGERAALARAIEAKLKEKNA